VLTTLALFGPLVVLAYAGATANADTIYVCWDGSGDYLTIQEGIDAAGDGDEVLVCDGIYTGSYNRDLDFRGKAITLRSADGPDNCIIDCEGSESDPHRGFYFHSGESGASVLDGFTIRGGNVLIDGADGGGLLCSHSSPTISNCMIVANFAVWGGGVYLQDSEATVSSCVITANTAAAGGGGVFCHAASPTIVDCTLTSNMAESPGGGAIYLRNSNPTITSCTIANNETWSSAGGGGIYCSEANPRVVLCTIVANGSGWGGGLYSIYDSSSPAITGCRVAGNFAERGGAVCCVGGEAMIADSTFAYNTAWETGGAYWGYDSATAMTNCILWGDNPDEIVDAFGAVTTVSYSDVQAGWDGDGNIDADPAFPQESLGTWTEQATYDPQTLQVTLFDATADWAHNELIGKLLNADTDPRCAWPFLVIANTQTAVVVSADPRTISQGDVWWDFSGKSYEIYDNHLTGDSPCINGGSNYAPDLPGEDIEGSPRIQHCRVDMGVYESPYPGTFEDCNENGVDDDCDIWEGTSADVNKNHVPDDCECVGDIDGDGDTDHADLGALLGAWDSQPGDPHWNPDADLDGDGHVGHSDLGILLTDWGCVSGMVFVAAGEFEMGDPWSEGGSHERPVHTVYLSSFYMHTYEATNQQYCEGLNWAWAQGGLITVTNGVVYQYGSGTDYPYCDTYSYDQDSRIHWDGSTFTVAPGKEDHPMLEVSWYGAVAYCNWRSAMEGKPLCYDLSTWTCDFGVPGYRLPTEAEWEKAAGWDPVLERHFRFGEHSDGCGYNCLDAERANYYGCGAPYDCESQPWTTPRGFYNGELHYKDDFGWPCSQETYQTQDAQSYYGCRDISGNVWEWCNDWYSSTYYWNSPPSNPTGPVCGQYRVNRGGSWYFNPKHCRSANREWCSPDVCNYYIGFRVASGTP